MSDSELYKALIAFQAEVRDPVKDSSNPHFKSRYADLHSVLVAVRPVLAKHGLAVAQTITVRDGQVHPLLETVLVHSSGAMLKSTVPLAVSKAGPQEFGSVMSYLRRYSLMALLGIAGADDDDDGESATQRGRQPQTTKAVTLAKDELVQFELVEDALAAFAACKTVGALQVTAKRCVWFKGTDKDTVAAGYRSRLAELGGGQ